MLWRTYAERTKKPPFPAKPRGQVNKERFFFSEDVEWKKLPERKVQAEICQNSREEAGHVWEQLLPAKDPTFTFPISGSPAAPDFCGPPAGVHRRHK